MRWSTSYPLAGPALKNDGSARVGGRRASSSKGDFFAKPIRKSSLGRGCFSASIS